MSGRVEASSRLTKRLLLCIVAVSGLLAVSAFVSANVGAQQSQQMVASWYGPGFEGATTASGAPFDPYGYTAAHKTLPFGTKLIVTYQGTSVVVEITDRGPYIAGRDLDLSQGAADYIGLTAAGEGVVDVVYADASTPVGPYSGTAAPVQQQAAPQNQTGTAPTQATSDTTTNVQNQYAENAAAGDQYAETDAVDDSAADDQYVAVEDQYGDETPVIEAAPGPVVPVVPAAGALEIPPVEFVKPDSTIERRIKLEKAAPPVDYVAPKVETETIDAVYEAPKVVTGITVLPDTGGLPLLPLAGVAASLLLLGGGFTVRALRR